MRRAELQLAPPSQEPVATPESIEPKIECQELAPQLEAPIHLPKILRPEDNPQPDCPETTLSRTKKDRNLNKKFEPRWSRLHDARKSLLARFDLALDRLPLMKRNLDAVSAKASENNFAGISIDRVELFREFRIQFKILLD